MFRALWAVLQPYVTASYTIFSAPRPADRRFFLHSHLRLAATHNDGGVIAYRSRMPAASSAADLPRHFIVPANERHLTMPLRGSGFVGYIVRELARIGVRTADASVNTKHVAPNGTGVAVHTVGGYTLVAVACMQKAGATQLDQKYGMLRRQLDRVFAEIAEHVPQGGEEVWMPLFGCGNFRNAAAESSTGAAMRSARVVLDSAVASGLRVRVCDPEFANFA